MPTVKLPKVRSPKLQSQELVQHTVQSEIASPCINICRLNDDQICIGCGRSSDEIAGWLRFTAARRLDLMDTVLPQRLESMID